MLGLEGWLLLWWVYKRHPVVDMQKLLHSSSELVVTLATRLSSVIRPAKGKLHVPLNSLKPMIVENRRIERRKKRWNNILVNFTCGIVYL